MSAVYTWRVHAWATSQLCSNFRRDLSYVFSVAPTILVVSFEQLDKLSWTQNFISHKLLYNRHDFFWFFLDRMCIVSVTAFVVKLYSFFASHLNINKYKRFSSFVRRRRMRGDSTMLLQGTPVFFFLMQSKLGCSGDELLIKASNFVAVRWHYAEWKTK